MRIFYDVDTQNDFMNSDGKLYVPDAETIKPNLKALTEFAQQNKIPIVGSVDAHVVNDPEFEVFPPHCIKGTKGQKKIDETKITWFEKMGDIPEEVAIYIPNYSDKKVKKLELVKAIADTVPLYPVLPVPALYFEKQHYDIFTNSAFEKFLELTETKQAVVYGVATDYCVKAAVMGMQQRKIQCYVVEDAIKGVAPETTQSALEEMAQAGAQFVTTKDVLEGRV